jgi:ribosomal protein L12E/L44/L45/RPP1/RPP2
LDALNSNPCMVSILATIDYLVSPAFAAASGESPAGSAAKQKEKEKEKEKEVPKWMSFLLAKITAAGTPLPNPARVKQSI